jgi:hypothetical protein
MEVDGLFDNVRNGCLLAIADNGIALQQNVLHQVAHVFLLLDAISKSAHPPPDVI